MRFIPKVFQNQTDRNCGRFLMDPVPIFWGVRFQSGIFENMSLNVSLKIFLNMSLSVSFNVPLKVTLKVSLNGFLNDPLNVPLNMSLNVSLKVADRDRDVLKTVDGGSWRSVLDHVTLEVRLTERQNQIMIIGHRYVN